MTHDPVTLALGLDVGEQSAMKPARPGAAAAAAHPACSLARLNRDATGRSQWEWAKEVVKAAGRKEAAKEVVDCEAPPSLQRFRQLHATLAARGGSTQPFWWQTRGVASAIAKELATHHLCVIDGFLSLPASAQLLAEVRSISRAGGLQEVAKVGRGHLHTTSDQQRALHRSDKIGWFTGTEPTWRVLPAYLDLVDHLVGLIRADSAAPSDVKGCLQRSRAMVACYPGNGARYAKHCDNACHDGSGPECNGRRLCVAPSPPSP